MANILGRGSPPQQVKMMDLATLRVTAIVDVLPQEQQDSNSASLPQHTSLDAMLRPIKDEEKEEEEEEEEWLPLQQPKSPKPMKKPRKRSRPTKIISQTTVENVLPDQEQEDSASFCSCLPQYFSSDAMLRRMKEEEKEEEEWLLQQQQSKTPEPMKQKQQQQRKIGPPRKIKSQSLSRSLVRRPPPQDDQSDMANRKKKKKKIDRGGGVDVVLPELPETPKRERSIRGGISITRRKVNCASPPSACSSSNFGKDFATTTGHNSVQSPPPPTSGLEMPGPIPDLKDLITTDRDFFKDFFEDLPQD